MSTLFTSPTPRRTFMPLRRQQRGISLFIIMVMLLLTMLLALGGVRLGVFNESVIGNLADSQRANAAAEALLRAAQADIRDNGLNCTAATCRFPRDIDEYNTLATTLMGTCGATTETQGVCIPNSPEDRKFQADYIMQRPADAQTTEVIEMRQRTARTYTDFGRTVKSGTADLSLTDARGQYWVEIYPFNTAASALADSTHLPIPDLTYPLIFRITVRAQGLKAGTVSILRAYYIPLPRKPI